MCIRDRMGPRGNKVASSLVKDSDLILAIGTRLGFNSTFYSYDNINKKAKIIQIELEKKMIGRYFRISIGILADASTVASQLLIALKQKKILPSIKDWTEKFISERSKFLKNREKIKSKNSPIQPNALFKELRKVLPKNTAITLDAGTLCLQATDSLNYFKPPSLFFTFRFWSCWFFFCMWIRCKISESKKNCREFNGRWWFWNDNI